MPGWWRGTTFAFALCAAVGLSGPGAAAQEGTRYQLYLHDPVGKPEAAEVEIGNSASPERRPLRDPAAPSRRHGGARLTYCNTRLHRQIDSCQATFGFGSPTYFRCQDRAFERFGDACMR